MFTCSLNAFYFRILSNYEIVDGRFTECEALLEHAREQKENFHEVTPSVLTKAVNEIFNGLSSKARSRQTRNGKSTKIWTYRNLSRKAEKGLKKIISFEVQWEDLETNGSDIAATGGLKWTFIKSNEFSLSFVRCETVLYDEQRVVSEISFTRCDDSKSINISMKYHQRKVPENDVKNIVAKFGDCVILEQASQLMLYLDSTYVCHGFDAQHYLNLQSKNSTLHTVTFSDLLVEERMFSAECQVITDATGKLCDKCKMERKNVKLRSDRHNASDGLMPAHCNHRYMSRAELVRKINKKRMSEQRLRKKIQKEMIDMEENDSNDLQTMMGTITKKDIPDDIQLFWEEQKKILKTDSKSQYRWHPRYIQYLII